jgi:hypothetical protein
MTGQENIDKFHNYVSDELDTDFEIQLVNDAKNSIEAELMMEVTKKLNSSASTTAGQTYTTARILPTDFYLPLVIYVGSTPYYPVPFERQQEYRDQTGFYWIDIANENYYLSGTQSASNTIYFYYQYETPDLTADTLATWEPVWKSRFHTLIPLEMARLYWQIDQGEKNRAWTVEYAAEYRRWKGLLQDWDARLKLNAMNNSVADYNTIESENRINLY